MLKMVQRTDESILVMFWIARGTVTFDCPQIKGKKALIMKQPTIITAYLDNSTDISLSMWGNKLLGRGLRPGIMLVSFQIRALHWQPPSVSTNRGAAVFVAPARD